ncbi:MAG TPA: hypothetical protein VLM84_09390 [Chromatiaceae bacterium]|nr:hypothetical protein [Chromatiaceae bacterium]
MGGGAWNGDGDLVAAHLDPMARRLNLTSEQKAKLEPIIRQRQELRAAQRQAVRDEVAVILTPGQIAQFDQMGPGRGAAWGAALVRDGVRAGRTRDGTTAGRRIPRPRPLFQCRSTQTLWLGKGGTRMTRTTHGAGRT